MQLWNFNLAIIEINIKNGYIDLERLKNLPLIEINNLKDQVPTWKSLPRSC